MASAELIDEVIMATGYSDKDLIATALAQNKNDANKVVNEYWENQAGFVSKYRAWNEQAFTADRDGNGGGSSYHIEAGEQTADSYYERLALSRPPSPSGNNSPMNRVAEWNMDSNKGPLDSVNNWNMANNLTQEEDDLQKALRLSAQESGIAIDGQDYGVIDSVSNSRLVVGGSHGGRDASAPPPAVFGPATAKDYDEGRWGMVPRSMVGLWNGGVTVVDIPASARQREPGAPGMLVLVDRDGRVAKDDRLAGALTIFHSIPMGRNLMLGGPECGGYGNNSGWWRGEGIPRTNMPVVQVAAVVEGEDSRMETGSQAGDYGEWPEYQDESVSTDEEVHRLVALLDGSDRSFGTINVLAEAMGGTYSLEPRVFDYLMGKDQTASQEVQTVVRTESISRERPTSDVDAEDSDDEDAKQELSFLDVSPPENNWPFIESLTDILDHLMWQDTVGQEKPPSSERSMTVIERQGNILVLHINTAFIDQPLEMPEVLSIERYMDERRLEAIGLMKLMVRHKRKLREVRIKLNALAMPVGRIKIDWAPTATSQSEVTTLSIKECEQKIAEYNGKKRYLKDRARFRVFADSGFDDVQFPKGADQIVGEDGEEVPVLMTEEDALLVMKLESLKEQMIVRKKAIEEEHQRLMRAEEFHVGTLKKLRKILTGTDKAKDKERSCQLMYLRGVACEDGVTFVCRREKTEDSEGTVDQWWRMSLDPSGVPAVTAEKTNYTNVLSAIWTSGKHPLIIYATEKALTTEPQPLPGSLTQFLRFDNRLFQTELRNSRPDLVDLTSDHDPDATDLVIPESTLATAVNSPEDPPVLALEGEEAEVGDDYDEELPAYRVVEGGKTVPGPLGVLGVDRMLLVGGPEDKDDKMPPFRNCSEDVHDGEVIDGNELKAQEWGGKGKKQGDGEEGKPPLPKRPE